MDELNKEKILRAGKIASEAREYARNNVKKGMKLIDIANMIEDKIAELGGKPAFPTCLSVNEIAAHATPAYNDERVAEGILKVDMGAHVDGWIADTAFSIDLEDSDENKKIVEASKSALDRAIKNLEAGIELREIGKTVYDAIKSEGLSPIVNLFGHSVNHYDLHSDISIPNFDNKSNFKLPEGLYAIEPFATSGNGRVQDGKPSGIYILIDDKNPRNPIAREIINFIIEEYQTLPFCSRWIVKKFGTKALIGLRYLEENKNLHSYAELVEVSKSKVSQAEHTILIEKGKITITTK